MNRSAPRPGAMLCVHLYVSGPCGVVPRRVLLLAVLAAFVSVLLPSVLAAACTVFCSRAAPQCGWADPVLRRLARRS